MALGSNPLIPSEHTEELIAHIVMVHGSVGVYSKKFLQKLRRSNYVTPKNYLDFINTYTKLLEDKNNYILGKRRASYASQSILEGSWTLGQGGVGV